MQQSANQWFDLPKQKRAQLFSRKRLFWQHAGTDCIFVLPFGKITYYNIITLILRIVTELPSLFQKKKY